MLWVKKIKTWLYNSGRGSVSSTVNLSSIFAPIDLAFLRERINIKIKGQENGASNIPRSDTKDLDSVESEIISASNDALRTYVSEYQTQLAVFNQRIKQSREVLKDFEIINQLKATIGDMRALVQEKKSAIFNQESSIEALSGEIANFREYHGLGHRTPVPGDSGKIFFKIAFAGLLEIALTAALIRDAGDLFTVASIATVFFFLNILVVFFLFCRFYKFKNANARGMPNIPLRFVGYCSLVVYLFYVVFLNLLFSHLRAVSSELERMLIENPDSYMVIFQSVGVIAFDEFKENLFVLPDVQSYALFILGLALSLYIFIQGYEYADKYPDYSNLLKRYNQEFDDFYNATEDTIKDFSNERDEGREKVQKLVERINISHENIPQFYIRAESLHHSFQQACSSLATSINVLLNEYREENIRHRNTPEPDHFKSHYFIQVPSVEKLSKELVPYPDKVIEDVNRYRDEIFVLFDKSIDEIKDLRRVLKESYPFKVGGMTNGST